MKTATVLSLLFLTIFLSACNKLQISLKQDPDIVGQYEWAYSFGAGNESESTETISDKYGIVLKKNGKAEMYENGEMTSKGFVVEINQGSNGSKELKLILDDLDVYLTFTGSELEYYSYPIENQTNIFQKQ